MSKLFLENVDDDLVSKLRQQAVANGITIEEEHLRILSQALKHEIRRESAAQRPSLAEFLLHGGDPWPEDFLPERDRSTNEHREVKF